MTDELAIAKSATFDILEALKPTYPEIAAGFARATGGIDLPYVLAVIRDRGAVVN